MADPRSLSDEQLMAIASGKAAPQTTGDLSHLSDEQLQQIAGVKAPPSTLFGPGGYMSRLGNAVTQGLTLGAGDEIVSGMLGATDYGVGKVREALGGRPGPSLNEAYTQALNETRGDLKRFRQENPIGATVGETAGGVFSPVGRIGADAMSAVMGPAKTLLGASARGGAIGGTLGGVGGFLSGEGDQGRLDSAMSGAQWGAALGGALPVAGAAFNAMRPASNAPAEKAREMVVRALQQDGMTAEQAAARWQSMLDQGFKPEAAFEMGGENLKNLAKGSATLPGEFQNKTTQFLNDRMRGQQARIGDDIKTNLSPNDDFYGSMDALIKQRSQAAEPLYEAAYKAGEGRWSPRAQELMTDPLVRQGVNKGLEVIRLEKLAKGEPFDPQAWGIKGYDPSGGPIVAEGPNIRLLDAAKRGLDAIIDESRDGFGRVTMTQRNRAIDQVRRAVVGQLDDLTEGAHAAARQAWGGPSQSMNAMEIGRSILREDAEVGAKAISKLSDGDKEFARAGLARALTDKIKSASDTGDAVKKIFGNNLTRERMEALFPSKDAFNSFASAMQREADMYANAQQVMPSRGSQTAGRLAAAEGILSDKGTRAATAAVDIASNPWNPINWLRMARAVYGGSNPKALDPKLSAALSEKLLATGPSGVDMFRALPSMPPPQFPAPNYGLLADLAGPASQTPRTMGLLGY